MSLSTIAISFITFLLALTACKSNDVKESTFSKLSPGSREYKDALAEKIRANPEGLTYILEKYVYENGREYLDVEVKGDDFEAKGLVVVKNWQKLEGIKRTQGQGYSGAELSGLQLEIQPGVSGAELVYLDLRKIVD